jgi:hypothetical protein
MSKTKKLTWFDSIKSSVWLFPLILFILLLLLTAFKISGSSVGVYRQVLYGNSSHDPDLVYGKPRAIRSDEWLSTTQLIVSQSKNHFPRFNQDMGSGRDVSLLSEVPSKDWSTLFRPQNWSFFIMPLEYAFAFKWWLIMFVLIVSCYFFTLRVLKGSRLFAALLAISLGISPFELWWYQSSSFLGIAYGFMMIILVMRITNGEMLPFIKNRYLSYSLQALALTYVIACFGLLLYPPFQIPVAIVVAFFVAGYLLNKRFTEHVRPQVLIKRVSLLLCSTVIAAFIGIAFIATHKPEIHALNSSIYPGHRLTNSGGLNFLNIFDGFVMPAEQSDFRGSHFFTNQSEASNFILLVPFLIIPAIALMAREWQLKKRVDWVFFAIHLCAILFFIRVFVHFGSSPFKLLLLNRVPHSRLLIGLGFLGILQLVYLMKKISESKLPRRTLILAAASYGAVSLIILLLIGGYIGQHYPLFLHNLTLVFIFATIFALIIAGVLSGMRLVAVGLLLIFTFMCSFRIMPLYRSLGIITDSKLANNISAISKPADSWAAVGDDMRLFENIALVADRKSMSGVQIYPDLNFWRQAGPGYESVYNREGHAFFIDNQNLAAPLVLSPARNAFYVKFECSNFIKKNIGFVLAAHKLNESCTQLIKTTKYPAMTFYLYEVTG